MKRLLTALLSMVTVFALASSTVSAAPRYWKVQISEPAATTDKSLNIDYNVSSTVYSDTFTVELFENGTSKGTQSVTHPYGNSGVFTIAIPAAGTYSYMIRATNHGEADATKDSATETVQVSDAPQPTVTTVTVTQPAPAGQTAAAGGLGGGAAAVPVGQVAGAAAEAAGGTGTTPAQAATTTTGTNGTNNAGSSVLGAEATAAKTPAVNNSKRNVAIGSLLVLLVAGAGYAIYRRRAIG